MKVQQHLRVMDERGGTDEIKIDKGKIRYSEKRLP
jgi:hypothetical protein